jgi:serine/threonine-protein kinase
MPANAAASRYELKELLGEGGMGIVYRALDTRTNSYVALKTLRDATDPATLDMFKREWEELGKLVHPNIVDVRDVDEIEENGVKKPCFIMPLLPGSTLAALIKSSSPRLNSEFVVNMVAQVCKGLQAAHEKDLIHRDLKPSNIFIMEDDTAKIIDFGLVHAIGNKSVTGLKGTWQYMAPEQIDGSSQPNRSFDIFALGVVAYEALTGHQPFKRAKFEDTVEAVRHFIPQAISERNPKVAQLVGKSVHVAMAKQPMHRYATAREFAETLQKAHQHQYVERFDPAKIRPRIDRAKRAFTGGDSDFASEILTELEAEGNLDPDITLLRSQIDEYNKQKRVRQLFEAAQTRLEQDEIPLALEKLQEILKIDPQNSDAIKLRKRIEQQRSQQQVSEWLDLARKHLDRHDFSEARRALKEVFNLKYDDPEAARLKAQVDAREKEVETARAEKEHLYSYALRHNQNGEISSALSKLEKLLELSRNVPGASVPERDKVFQAFYNDVRTERDRIDKAYSEGKRHLSEKNFEKSLQTCDEILARYPQNPQFQALRLKVEHSQRQELSAYIAEVGRAVDTEPNLDRRVGLLEEACKRYPSEGQFSRQLSLARDLRDLVASIVTRARNYEEQGQFAEAIAQWNTLANIHPQYPGIDFEINQLERRREQQGEEEKKSRLVEKIDRALGNAAYGDAERLSQDGLLEFPQNPELLALLRLSRQGLEQSQEANRLFEEAKTRRTSGDLDQAVALLRKALNLDKRNIVVLNTLVNLLIERAHALLDIDPAAAEPLAAEADWLDPEHPSVKKVIALITQAKRKYYVERTVLEARQLQTTDRNQAIDVLKRGLTLYPGEGRLQQTLTSLQKEEPRTIAANAFSTLPEDKTVVYPIDQAARPPAPAIKPVGRPPVQPAPPKAMGPSRWQTAGKQIRETGNLLLQNVKTRFGGESRNLTGVLLGLLVGLLASLIVIGLASWYYNRTPIEPIAKPSAKQFAKQLKITIRTTPADANITVDGNPIDNTTFTLDEGSTHRVAVSRLGYQTIENPAMKVTGPTWDFSLAPEPLHISVSVSEPTGSVWLDDRRVGELDDGTWSSVSPLTTTEEQHVVSVKNKRGELLFTIRYAMAAGKLAVVDPLRTKDLLVASSLGKEAILYSGNPSSQLAPPDQERKRIPAEGLRVNVEDATGSFNIADGSRLEPLTVGATHTPALSISLNAAPNLTQISISVTPANARLFIEGEPMPHPRKPGVWTWMATSGVYRGKLTADGMNDENFSIPLKKGFPFNRRYEMKPSVPAGPPLATLVISGGEPNAAVSADGSAIGELNDQGSLTYNGIQPGLHEIQVSKSGYQSFSSTQTFYAGKTLTLPDVRRLDAEAGYARVSVSPGNARVYYVRSGSNEQHAVSDLTKAISLPPGTYEFTADADKYLQSRIPVSIEPKVTKAISLVLEPVRTLENQSFLDPNDVIKNGNWFTGREGKAKDFILLRTPYKKNTILFSKAANAKRVSWKVYLDNDNHITYTLESKHLSVTKTIDGQKAPPLKLKDFDLTGIGNASGSYVVVMSLERNGVNALEQDGKVFDSTNDDKHDWSHARISVKGDAYFTMWPGL